MTPVPAQHSLLSGLFDFSFDRLITPKIIKFIYALVLVFGAVAYLGYTVFAFQVSSALGVLVLLIFGPLGFLFTAIFWRVGLELAIAIFKIAENTGRGLQPVGAVTPPSPSTPINPATQTDPPPAP